MNLSSSFSGFGQKIRNNPRVSSFISYIQADKKHLLLVLILISAIPLTVVAALTQQETRQRASGIVLSRAEVSPGEITAKVNGPNVPVSALAYDDSNNPIFSGVLYEWSMSSINSVATLTNTSGDITQLDPLSVGYGEITVIARLGSQNITKGLAVRIANPDGSFPPPPATPTPTPTPVPTPTKPGPLKVLNVTDSTDPNVKYVEVDWPDTPNANSYNVYLKESVAPDYIFSGNILGSTFKFKVNKDLTYSTYVEALGAGAVVKSDVLNFRACDYIACTYTFNPSADSFVDGSTKSSRATNYGASDLLKVGLGGKKFSFVKFDLSSLKGNVGLAKLKVYVSQGNKGAFVIRNVPDTSWTESGITWSNQPNNDKTIVGGFENPKNGQWVEIDITSYLKNYSGKVVSMNLRSNGDNEITLNSKNSSNPPELKITTQP